MDFETWRWILLRTLSLTTSRYTSTAVTNMGKNRDYAQTLANNLPWGQTMMLRSNENGFGNNYFHFDNSEDGKMQGRLVSYDEIRKCYTPSGPLLGLRWQTTFFGKVHLLFKSTEEEEFVTCFKITKVDPKLLQCTFISVRSLLPTKQHYQIQLN
jgi:hypothetical protein